MPFIVAIVPLLLAFPVYLVILLRGHPVAAVAVLLALQAELSVLALRLYRWSMPKG